MMEGTTPGAIMSWLRQDGQQVDNAEQATALRQDCPGHDPNFGWRLCVQAGSLWAALYPGFILVVHQSSIDGSNFRQMSV